MALEGWTVPPLWKGERCFIIAGGSSVMEAHRKHNLARLPGRIIAIKDAVRFAPFADCMFYADAHLHRDRPDIFYKYRGSLIVKRAVHQKVPAHVRQVRRVWVPKGVDLDKRISGLSTDPALLGGFDSGGSALNLAFHLGATDIILVGFDLRGKHWNPDHPLRDAGARVHRIHQRSIDAMAKPLRNLGVTVRNASPNSSLQEFPYVDLAKID